MKKAYIDDDGTFHCSCGIMHSRGPINGLNSFRCMSCGQASIVDINKNKMTWFNDAEVRVHWFTMGFYRGMAWAKAKAKESK